jgi:two-component system CheB/CheR fusion protein
VEDSPDTAETERTLLQVWGHVAVTVRDGALAVRAAEYFAPNVVLLDLGLPGMEGFEVARRLRQLPGKQPVIVCISGYATAEDQRKVREAGCGHFLAKPADPDTLQRLLRAIEDRLPPSP